MSGSVLKQGWEVTYFMEAATRLQLRPGRFKPEPHIRVYAQMQVKLLVFGLCCNLALLTGPV